MTYPSLTDQAVGVLSALFDALRQRGEITIRSADLDGLAGVTRFADNLIYLASSLDPARRRATLAHELRHVSRGPIADGDIEREEDCIECEVADLLFPNGRTLADLVWTPQQQAVLAAHLHLDPDTLAAALNPPTMPLRRAVPQIPDQRSQPIAWLNPPSSPPPGDPLDGRTPAYAYRRLRQHLHGGDIAGSVDGTLPLPRSGRSAAPSPSVWPFPQRSGDRAKGRHRAAAAYRWSLPLRRLAGW